MTSDNDGNTYVPTQHTQNANTNTMPTPTEYTITYLITDKHSKLVAKTEVTFTIRPELETKQITLLKCDYGAFTQCNQGKFDELVGEKERKLFKNKLEEWLFKRTPFPPIPTITYEGDDHHRIAWFTSPAFTEEDKEEIKRRYVVDEL